MAKIPDPLDSPNGYVHPHAINSLTPMGTIIPPTVRGEYKVDRAVLKGVVIAPFAKRKQLTNMLILHA